LEAHFIVFYDADAVRELESLKGRRERNAVFIVIDKLRMLGPELAPPHVKSLKGEERLLELRPRQGSSSVRPICRRIGNRYVILAFSVKPDKPISTRPWRQHASVQCATKACRINNSRVIIVLMAAQPKTVSYEALLAEEMARDPDFREEWEQTALARLVAVQLIKYRATNKLSQRALAEKLGKKQPYVARLEAGETNPDLETLVNISRALGIEFVIDIAPAAKTPELVTREVAAEHATRRRSGVSVVVAAVG